MRPQLSWQRIYCALKNSSSITLLTSINIGIYIGIQERTTRIMTSNRTLLNDYYLHN